MFKYNITYWDEESTIKEFEYWTLNDTYHKENEPAFISYYQDGSLESEEYFENGLRHNLKGPAWIYYHEDGTVEYKKYYIHGVSYSKTAWRRLRKEFLKILAADPKE